MQKAKESLQELGSTACAEQAMPAAGSHGTEVGRGRQALPMSSCLARRQDAVLVSIVLLTRETTYFISEWQQTVGRGQHSAGVALGSVTACARDSSGAVLIGDPRANTPGS